MIFGADDVFTPPSVRYNLCIAHAAPALPDTPQACFAAGPDGLGGIRWIDQLSG